MVTQVPDLAAFERRRRQLTRDYELTLSQAAHNFEHGTPSVWGRSLYSWKRQFLSHYFRTPPAWRLALRRFGGKRAPADFAVLGAVKSGTSDLSVNLLMHPNVVAPIAKEFHPWDWSRFNPTQQIQKRHAERFGIALIPYLDPTLHRLEVIHHLAQARPRCRIVLALREPAARMYSHWKWEMLWSGRKRAERLPFLATFAGFVNHALEMFPDAPMHTSCGLWGLSNSIYWKSVRYWIDWCGAENVMTIDVGEYFRDRDNVLRRIQNFVGLPYVAIPPAAKPVNENPLNLPPADEESLAKLRAFFAPCNERLWGVIGRQFAW